MSLSLYEKIKAKTTSSHLPKIERLDSRIALLRLFGTVLFLMLLSSLWSSVSTAALFFISVIGVLGFAAVTHWHQTIQKKKTCAHAFLNVLQAKTERARRDFAALRKRTHYSIESSTLSQHPYALDLDLPQLVFPWLDTCAFSSSSLQLSHVLLKSGVESLPVSNETIQKRKGLLRFPRVLNRLEMLRYLMPDSSSFQEPNKQKGVNKKIIGIVHVTLLFVLFGLWTAGWNFFLTKGNAQFSGENVLTWLSPYILMVILDSVVSRFWWEEDSSFSAQRIKKISVFLKTLHDLYDDPLFKDHTKVFIQFEKKLKQVSLAFAFMGVRQNPILWVILQLVLPIDALMSRWGGRSLKALGSQMVEVEHHIREVDLHAVFARVADENKATARFIEKNSEPALKLEVKNLVHPLLAPQKAVSHSVTLDAHTKQVILTGSNMSGKSTFLRSLGLNLLLYYCGAPVFASHFKCSVHKILCAIRVDDSLADAASYFYAEVKRLKLILDSVKNAPQNINHLYLIDEIFKGTNQKERELGSAALLQELIKGNALGVVSTHDLALTKLADSQNSTKNMHFREHINNNELQFDYQLREGPCPTTNALWIMRHAGLPVPEHVLSGS